jgi:hypothetical protein
LLVVVANLLLLHFVNDSVDKARVEIQGTPVTSALFNDLLNQ